METPKSKWKKKNFDGDFLNAGKGGFLDDDNLGNNFNMRKMMNELDRDDKSNLNGL